jgi:lipopolysaccharide biosynthesis glycosyltransferase
MHYFREIEEPYSEPKENVLVTLCNDDINYIHSAMSLFYSAKKYGKWKGKYVLLGYKLSKENVELFETRGVKVYNVIRDIFDGYRFDFEDKHRDCSFFHICYCKYLLFSNLFSKYQKVVFFDADNLILGNINGLLTVQNFGVRYNRSFGYMFFAIGRNTNSKEHKELLAKYDFKTPAFGAGFLVIDYRFIGDFSYKRLLQLTNKYGHLSFSVEESILNLFIKENGGAQECRGYDLIVDGNVLRKDAELNEGEELKSLHIAKPKAWLKESAYYDIFLESYADFLEKFDKEEGFAKL